MLLSASILSVGVIIGVGVFCGNTLVIIVAPNRNVH